MKYIILIALFALVVAADEPIRKSTVYDRTCEERSAEIRPQVKTAYNVAAYSGTWFEIERYQQDNEPEVDCLISSYAWQFISRQFTIFRDAIDLSNGDQWTRDATALLAFPEEDPTLGLLNVTYYAGRAAQGTNYYVLGTDYFQYAVVWACEDLEDDQSREYAWVMSRTPILPDAYEERVLDYKLRFFDLDLFRPTDQDIFSCFDAQNNELRKKLSFTKNN